MKRHISFGSINQFRNAITAVTQCARYTGKDDEGNVTYDKHIVLPTLTVTASEKIHGTNAAVCFSNSTGLYVQSRENIITPEKDNFGCATWVAENEDTWIEIIAVLVALNDVDIDTQIISVYFEWCGGSIQQQSAVSNLEKRAIIFQHFKVSPLVASSQDDANAPDPAAYWEETSIADGSGIERPDSEIYNIMNFPTYEFEIDFEKAAFSQNKMIEQVAEIEANSPVGKQFGVDGNIGEGIVCTVIYKDKLVRFKVKGEKHASGRRVKTLTPVDEAKEQIKIDFVNYACSQSRLAQAWDKTFFIGQNEEIFPVVEKTGDFLRAVVTDVMKEESDIMEEKEIIPKAINGTISKVARRWFMEQLDKEAGL